MFSIAIPVYGQAQFISSALKSIKAQSVDCELAVMDATPDNSVQQIINRYTDIIHYRRHGKDNGQSEAIVEGWDHTSGEIITWLCADDYYFPDTLERVKEVFHAHPDVDVVYGDCVFVDAEDQFKMYFPAIERDVSCLPVHDCISQPACFVRRKALKKIGGLNTDLHYVMDWDIWCRLYHHGAKFFYLQKPLAISRIYSETKTGSMSPERYKEINAMLKLQPSYLRRIWGLIGTLYYDLRENRKNFVTHALYVLLDICRSFKQQRFSSSPRQLYGLELWSNHFQGYCELFLAWYRDERPEQVRLIVSPPIADLSLRCNEIALHLLRHTADGEYTFALPDEWNQESGLSLAFKLTCSPAQRCQLHSFMIK